jgi:hypothetical protein
MTANRRLTLAGTLIVLMSLQLSAQQQTSGMSQSKVSVGVVTRAGGARALSSTRSDLVSVIQGNALSSTNGQLPNALVRLRDARFGKIVGAQTTDRLGLFEFKSVEPGTYIVEMVSPDQTILAASQLLSVNAGEAVSAVVKLPFKVPPFAGLLANSNGSVLALTSQAASSAILTVAPMGDATCDLGQGSS